MPQVPSDIVAFWIAAGPKAWFAKDDAFDAALRTRFEAAHHAAARGEFGSWAETAEGALALLLLLDQVPRNLYRATAHAFATDPLARRCAAAAIARGFDQAYPPDVRCFFYLPFEHSQDARDQARAVELFQALGDPEYLRYAQVHADIIARFGRFPHRNTCLGRASTSAELEFLAEGGFAG